jgi:hypothetical protein
LRKLFGQGNRGRWTQDFLLRRKDKTAGMQGLVVFAVDGLLSMMLPDMLGELQTGQV